MTSVPGYFLMKSASSLLRAVFLFFVIAGFPIPWTGSPPSYRHATARGNALLQKKKLNPHPQITNDGDSVLDSSDRLMP
jgi:hypothetical protein